MWVVYNDLWLDDEKVTEWLFEPKRGALHRYPGVQAILERLEVSEKDQLKGRVEYLEATNKRLISQIQELRSESQTLQRRHSRTKAERWDRPPGYGATY